MPSTWLARLMLNVNGEIWNLFKLFFENIAKIKSLIFSHVLWLDDGQCRCLKLVRGREWIFLISIVHYNIANWKQTFPWILTTLIRPQEIFWTFHSISLFAKEPNRNELHLTPERSIKSLNFIIAGSHQQLLAERRNNRMLSMFWNLWMAKDEDKVLSCFWLDLLLQQQKRWKNEK